MLERDDYSCIYCGRPVLHQPYSLQHRKARGVGGANAPSNLITLCGSATSPDGCHLFAEQRHAEARDDGLWVPSWDDPALVPVAHWRLGHLYLTDCGGYQLVPHVNGDES